MLDFMHVRVPKGAHHTVDIIKGVQIRLEVLGHGMLELLQRAFFLVVAHAIVGKRRHETHDFRIVLEREQIEVVRALAILDGVVEIKNAHARARSSSIAMAFILP